MADALGLLGIAVFIVCTIALAAGVTWVVVRFSPNPNKRKSSAAADSKT